MRKIKEIEKVRKKKGKFGVRDGLVSRSMATVLAIGLAAGVAACGDMSSRGKSSSKQSNSVTSVVDYNAGVTAVAGTPMEVKKTSCPPEVKEQPGNVVVDFTSGNVASFRVPGNFAVILTNNTRVDASIDSIIIKDAIDNNEGINKEAIPLTIVVTDIEAPEIPPYEAVLYPLRNLEKYPEEFTTESDYRWVLTVKNKKGETADIEFCKVKLDDPTNPESRGLAVLASDKPFSTTEPTQ